MTPNETTPTGRRRRAVPIQTIVELWERPMTVREVAAELGLTHQRISQRLIEAGYDPGARLAQQRAGRVARGETFRQQRAETIRLRSEAREAAVQRFLKIAEEYDVKPWTLGQWCALTGTYKRLKNDSTDGRYGSGKLPPRKSQAGIALAQNVANATAPWTPRGIGERCSRRASARRSG